jgi:hypothetical protein
MAVDREYRIRISTAGDPSGAQAVAGALDQTTGATKEASKATEKHTVGLHAMHKVFHSLNDILPGLGVMLEAAFSPVGAAISIAVLALRTFQEHMRKVNEEMKRMEEEAAKPLTNRLEAMRASVVTNAVGMAALHDRLGEAARGQQSLAAETEHAAAAMREQIGAVEALGEAQKSGELALLDNIHAAGLLSEEQYAEQKLAIEQAYLEKKRALEERQEMTEILLRRRALERAKVDQPGLTAAAEASEGNREKALENLASLRPRAEIDEDKNKTAAALKAFEEKYTQWARWFADFGVSANPVDVSARLGTRENLSAFQASGGFRGAVGGPGLSEAYGEWVRLKTGADAANAAWKQAPGEEAKRKVAADAAGRDADRAAKRAEENEKFAADEARDLEERRRRLRDRQQANQELSQTERDINKLKTPIGALATQDAAQAEATGLAIEQHKPVGAQAEEQLREVGTAIAGHNVSLQTAVQMMHWARQNNETVVTTATRLADAMLALVGEHSQLKGKVAMIESQVHKVERITNTLPGN